MVPDRENGGLVVEGLHLLREESANSTEKQAANPEGVLAFTALHHSGNLPSLVPLHIHTPEHGKTTQLRVVRVTGHRCHRVRGWPRSGGGGAAARPVPTERNRSGLMEVTEHGLVLKQQRGCESVSTCMCVQDFSYLEVAKLDCVTLKKVQWACSAQVKW